MHDESTCLLLPKIVYSVTMSYYTQHSYIFTCVYLNTIIQCGVLLHNDLIGCNYCDTSSPHNAMHSSSLLGRALASPTM